MANEIKERNNGEIVYQTGGQDVKLSPSIVTQFITKGNGEITKQEAFNFMQLCRYAELNPFLNEAYIVKFGNQPAQLITSKEAFMKRAERQKTYDGFEAGVVVIGKEGNLIKREGSIVLKSEELVGGWAKVYREDRNRPTTVEINFEEFAKYKQDGKTLQATWAQQPANMIRKSALVNALREAYPDQLGAMYTEDDKSPQEVISQAEKVEVEETTASLLNELNKDDSSKSETLQEEEPEVSEEAQELLNKAEKQAQRKEAEQIEVAKDDEQGELFKGRTIDPNE